MKFRPLYRIMRGDFGYDGSPFIHHTPAPFFDSVPLFDPPVVEISRHDSS